MDRRMVVLVLAALALLAPSSARAEEDTAPPAEKPKAETAPLATKPGYVQLFFTSFFGEGLRFNNPYRLATPLGGDAESVSRTAPYVDIGFAATFGHPLGLQHGAALRTTVAALAERLTGAPGSAPALILYGPLAEDDLG